MKKEYPKPFLTIVSKLSEEFGEPDAEDLPNILRVYEAGRLAGIEESAKIADEHAFFGTETFIPGRLRALASGAEEG